MAKQFSVTVRNGMLDSIETSVGTAPRLHIRTGAPPADCATAASGTLLVDMALPSDWLGAASAGVKSLSGTWQVNATTAGTAGHYRIMNTGATVCHEQGTVTITGSGGDMTLDNTNIAAGQQVTITSYTLNAGNA